MQKNVLTIKNLNISINKNQILKNVNLCLHQGDCAVILGPNGEGKSTLLKAIMGNNSITYESGEIFYNEILLNPIPINERSLLGIFLINQNPIEIEGITQIDFYKSILKAHHKKTDIVSLYSDLNKKLEMLNLNKDVLTRFLNFDFSGGEKKKNEIIQMLLIDPKLILIDEVDSGLDVDAIERIGQILKEQLNQQKTIIFITHNEQLIKILKPNKTFLIGNHTILKEGDYDFALEIMQKGFHKVFNELEIKIPKQPSLQVCHGNRNNEKK